ncbi:MAG: ABC transporter substrate-binding protein [Bradymonadaceae bacterium]
MKRPPSSLAIFLRIDRRATALGWTAALLLLCLLGSACLIPSKRRECSSHRTCRQEYGPTHLCASDGICEARPCETDGVCRTEFGATAECREGRCQLRRCSSDGDCRNAFGPTARCRSGVCRRASCESDRACRSSFGPTARCSDGTCEKLDKSAFLDAPCDFSTSGPVFEQGTYNIGVILALDPDFKFHGLIEPIADAFRLAQSDINAVSGVDGHPLGLIFCDTRGENARARRAAQHLADIGVEAVVGPDLSSYTVEIAPDPLAANQILTISPSATSPALSNIGDDDYFWRTAPSDEIQTRALASLVDQIPAKVQSVPDDPTERTTVMVTRAEDSYANGLRSGVVEHLPSDTVERIHSLSYSNEGRSDFEDYRPIARKIASKKPDLVMLWGLSEVWNIIRLADRELQGAGIDDTIFVTADGGKDSEQAAQTDSSRSGSGLTPLTGRIWGTVPRSLRADEYNPYKLFKSTWATAYATSADEHAFVANAYDAVYLVAFAAAHAGRFHGPALRDGMRRIAEDGGVDIVAGQQQFQKGVRALQGGDSIAFRGASGPIDFNESGGPSSANIALWCYKNGTIESEGDLLKAGSTDFRMQTCN